MADRTVKNNLLKSNAWSFRCTIVPEIEKFLAGIHLSVLKWMVSIREAIFSRKGDLRKDKCVCVVSIISFRKSY